MDDSAVPTTAAVVVGLLTAPIFFLFILVITTHISASIMQTSSLGFTPPELKKFKPKARHKVYSAGTPIPAPLKAKKKKLVLKIAVTSPLMKKALKSFVKLTPKA